MSKLTPDGHHLKTNGKRIKVTGLPAAGYVKIKIAQKCAMSPQCPEINIQVTGSSRLYHRAVVQPCVYTKAKK